LTSGTIKGGTPQRKDNYGWKRVRFVENEIDIVVKSSTSEKFKHYLNSIKHIGAASLPTKGGSKGVAEVVLVKYLMGWRWRFVKSSP
jgi:hypothetical protein